MTDLEDRFVLNSQSYKNNGKLLLERLDYIIIFQYELRLYPLLILCKTGWISRHFSHKNGAQRGVNEG